METYHTLPNLDLEEIRLNLGLLNCLELNNKDILILGGEGALGTVIKTFLLYLNDTYNYNIRVVSVDNYIGRDAKPSIIHNNLTNITQDLILPFGEWTHQFNFNYIFNMAGNAAPISGYSRFKRNVMDISYLGTKNALELAKYHDAKIVCMSSSEVVGNCPKSELPSDEDAVLRLNTTSLRACYDLFKAAGIETQCHVFSTEENVKVKVVRPFNVQFYYRQGDSRIVCSFMDKILKGQKLPIFLPGTQNRTYCWYSEFIAGLFKVILNGKQFLYHLGREEENVTALEIGEKIQKLAGYSDKIEIVETHPVFKHEPQNRQPSTKRAREELGYITNVTLDEMLSRTFEWCKINYKY